VKKNLSALTAPFQVSAKVRKTKRLICKKGFSKDKEKLIGANRAVPASWG